MQREVGPSEAIDAQAAIDAAVEVSPIQKKKKLRKLSAAQKKSVKENTTSQVELETGVKSSEMRAKTLEVGTRPGSSPGSPHGDDGSDNEASSKKERCNPSGRKRTTRSPSEGDEWRTSPSPFPPPRPQPKKLVPLGSITMSW